MNDDILTLALSEKETDFVEAGFKINFDVATNMAEVVSGFPYIGSLVKLGSFGSRYIEYRFIKKAATFLRKDVDIPLEQKERFLNGLTPKERKRISEYIMQYLLRAEDDEKAELMGFVYEECVYGKINHEMLLRLCSVIDKAFIFDLRELPEYAQGRSDASVAANNFVNWGLIDNNEGGVWQNEPSFQLNEIGMKLYEILNQNNWFCNSRVWCDGAIRCPE